MTQQPEFKKSKLGATVKKLKAKKAAPKKTTVSARDTKKTHKKSNMMSLSVRLNADLLKILDSMVEMVYAVASNPYGVNRVTIMRGLLHLAQDYSAKTIYSNMKKISRNDYGVSDKTPPLGFTVTREQRGMLESLKGNIKSVSEEMETGKKVLSVTNSSVMKGLLLLAEKKDAERLVKYIQQAAC